MNEKHVKMAKKDCCFLRSGFHSLILGSDVGRLQLESGLPTINSSEH